jgi:dihydrodipicolinate synthase/N-acetylneuraminate lyase
VTPFTSEGRIDVTTLKQNVTWLLEQGARHGNAILLAAGSGGDFPMMSLDERRTAVAAIADAAEGQAPIIAGAQALDWRDSLALCRTCDQHGVDAIQIAGPYYYDGRPGDVEAWMDELASHTAMPFAVYNNWYTGYDMPLDLVERLLDIPNAVGVKWASPNIDVFTEGVYRLGERVAVINNTLNSVYGHLVGCRAYVSHWPNFYPEFCWTLSDLMDAQRYGEAQAYFDGVMRPYRALVAEIAAQTAGEGVFVRPFMQEVGLDGGRSPLPSRDAVITAGMRQRMRDVLENARQLTASAAVAGRS